jgi:Rrf2 family protein
VIQLTGHCGNTHTIILSDEVMIVPMKLSCRAEYGLLALVDLAIFSGDRPLQAKQIAERQGIPKQYLDQLMMDLKRAGLVLSSRGRQGGYQLARPGNTITLWEAIATFGVPIDSGRFLRTRGNRVQASRKIVKQFWDDACLQFMGVLKKNTIEDVCRAFRKSLDQPTYQI